jgi:chromosome segregation ATPase
LVKETALFRQEQDNDQQLKQQHKEQIARLERNKKRAPMIKQKLEETEKDYGVDTIEQMIQKLEKDVQQMQIMVAETIPNEINELQYQIQAMKNASKSNVRAQADLENEIRKIKEEINELNEEMRKKKQYYKIKCLIFTPLGNQKMTAL